MSSSEELEQYSYVLTSLIMKSQKTDIKILEILSIPIQQQTAINKLKIDKKYIFLILIFLIPFKIQKQGIGSCLTTYYY